MKKRMLARTKYDSDIDYDDVANTFTRASGSKVWCERDGKYMNILTDGDPDEVVARLVHKSLEVVIGDALEVMMSFNLSGMRKWEQNARLN